MREIRNNICRKNSAGDTKNNRVVGEEHPTVDTTLRIWDLTRPARK
jgi:hypothetical protein